jgi:hypothetical protein
VTGRRTSSTTTTTSVPLDIVQLQPIRVDCTSELADFLPALIDDDPDNSWNARDGGAGWSRSSSRRCRQ